MVRHAAWALPWPLLAAAAVLLYALLRAENRHVRKIAGAARKHE